MKKSNQRTAGSHAGRRAQGTKTERREQQPASARGVAKPEFATFEVRPLSGGPATKSTTAPLVSVTVTWPAGQAECPNPAAKAVLDAVGSVVAEFTYGAKLSEPS